jgi:hypothetical protein
VVRAFLGLPKDGDSIVGTAKFEASSSRLRLLLLLFFLQVASRLGFRTNTRPHHQGKENISHCRCPFSPPPAVPPARQASVVSGASIAFNSFPTPAAATAAGVRRLLAHRPPVHRRGSLLRRRCWPPLPRPPSATLSCSRVFPLLPLVCAAVRCLRVTLCAALECAANAFLQLCVVRCSARLVRDGCTRVLATARRCCVHAPRACVRFVPPLFFLSTPHPAPCNPSLIRPLPPPQARPRSFIFRAASREQAQQWVDAVQEAANSRRPRAGGAVAGGAAVHDVVGPVWEEDAATTS